MIGPMHQRRLLREIRKVIPTKSKDVRLTRKTAVLGCHGRERFEPVDLSSREARLPMTNATPVFRIPGTDAFSKIISDCAVETTALTELRRVYADATAVTQLVNLVEQVHNIESHLKGPDLRDSKAPLQ